MSIPGSKNIYNKTLTLSLERYSGMLLGICRRIYGGKKIKDLDNTLADLLK